MTAGFGGLLVVAGSLLLAACAGGPGSEQRVTQAKSLLQSTSPCCSSLAEARRMPLPAAPADVAIDERAQVYSFDDAKAYFVLLELPAFSVPYSVGITSVATAGTTDQSVLVPRVALFDAEFKRTRLFGSDDLRRRGSNLERTVFINAADARERYIVIYGSELPTIERSYSGVTNTPVVVGAGVLNLVGGQEAKLSVRSSPIGTLRLGTSGLNANAGVK